MCMGDEECNEKLALSMLVQMLGKKTLSNIYKEYEVQCVLILKLLLNLII